MKIIPNLESSSLAKYSHCENACPAGPPGPPGESGSPGKPGLQGEPGLDGLPGSQGQLGAAGPPGIAGSAGEPGRKGEPGVDGLPGSQGQLGAAGPPGIAGSAGEPGRKGEPGVKGLPGPPGEAGLPGVSGSPCKNGISSNGLTGPSIGPWAGRWKLLSTPNWVDYVTANNYQQKTLQSLKRIVLIKKEVNFNAALRICETMGGKVLLPVSEKENKEILEFITKYLEDKGVWLRISDDYEEGTWRDTFDQTEWNGFKHWREYEPNNYGEKEHNAVIHPHRLINSRRGGTWNDVDDIANYNTICEFE